MIILCSFVFRKCSFPFQVIQDHFMMRGGPYPIFANFLNNSFNLLHLLRLFFCFNERLAYSQPSWQTFQMIHSTGSHLFSLSNTLTMSWLKRYHLKPPLIHKAKHVCLFVCNERYMLAPGNILNYLLKICPALLCLSGPFQTFIDEHVFSLYFWWQTGLGLWSASWQTS